MSAKPLLSVVIPAYNESENFRKGTLDSVITYLNKVTYSYEILIIDDGSTDSTVSLLEKFVEGKHNWKLIKNPHAGKAKTVETGMLKAQGQIRLFTDFDQATPISEVDRVIDKYNQGYQVIIGSREVSGAARSKEPPLRHLMGRVFNLLVQIIALRGVSDSQCGFKAFSEQATKDLFSSLVVYKNKTAKDSYTGAFDVELLFLARKRHYKICQIPVAWQYVDSTRVNPLKDSIRMLIDILKIRITYVLGKYAHGSKK